ncbi:DUF6374 family protein [Nocardia ninae]|uniref:DUF6374 family protein n=1 Tax=Nocardia ninae TaxID=356145 RepID=UPI001C994F63
MEDQRAEEFPLALGQVRAQLLDAAALGKHLSPAQLERTRSGNCRRAARLRLPGLTQVDWPRVSGVCDLRLLCGIGRSQEALTLKTKKRSQSGACRCRISCRGF